MKLSSQFIVVALATMGVLGTAAADDVAEIKTLYRTLSNAMGTTDPAKAKTLLTSLAAPDFVYIDGQGTKHTLADSVGQIQQQAKMIQKGTRVVCAFTPGSVKVSGNTATVNDTSVFRAMMLWTDKKPHTFGDNASSMDTLKKIGGKWKVSEVRVKVDHMTLDGKPIKM